MSKILIIVESPSKCKKIESFLGKDYKVVASYGHFTTFNSYEQINWENYNIKYNVSKSKQLNLIKNEVKKSKEVIIATDDDREGEAIGWLLCIFCKLNIGTTKRIVFQEITKDAILRALNNYRHIDIKKVESQKCRQILDLYLGYEISPLLWTNIQHKLSAGRCQSPALKLIYDNQKEYEAQDGNTHYYVYGTFTNKNIKFIGDSHVSKGQIDKFVEQQKDKKSWNIDDYSVQSLQHKQPRVLITSTLQQLASSKLRFSPSMTMSYAQELYENGYITYMRTDSPIYSKDFVDKLKLYIEKNYGNQYLMRDIMSLTSKSGTKGNKTQDAHEGIHVCDLNMADSNVKTENANRLYKLIYKHSVQCGMSCALYENHKYIVNTTNDKSCYKFIHTCKNYTFLGWKILEEQIEDDSTHNMAYLKNVYESKSNMVMKNIVCEETLMHSKTHYSESGLIQNLERKGIGRPSTYSGIIKSLFMRNYVDKKNIDGIEKEIENIILNQDKNVSKIKEMKKLNSEKGKIHITEVGKHVCQFCYLHFDSLLNYDFTGKMEYTLDEIAIGQASMKEVLDEYIQTVKDMKHRCQIFIKDHPESSVKRKQQTSLYCGNINDKVSYIKKGPYGYYLTIDKRDKISMSGFKGFNIEDIIESGRNEITEQERQMIQEYINESNTKKNINILVEINEDYSIRKSKYGYYVYYKTSKMKKPKFMRYNDEKDERNTERNSWVENNDREAIIQYLSKKYNLSI